MGTKSVTPHMGIRVPRICPKTFFYAKLGIIN